MQNYQYCVSYVTTFFWVCSPEKMQTSYMSTSYHWEVSVWVPGYPALNDINYANYYWVSYINTSFSTQPWEDVDLLPVNFIPLGGVWVPGYPALNDINYANYYCVSYINTSFSTQPWEDVDLLPVNFIPLGGVWVPGYPASNEWIMQTITIA